jgi:hypothetical protein
LLAAQFANDGAEFGSGDELAQDAIFEAL